MAQMALNLMGLSLAQKMAVQRAARLAKPKSTEPLLVAHRFKLLNDDGETEAKMAVLPHADGGFVLVREKAKSMHPVEGQAVFGSVEYAERWCRQAHGCGVRFD